MADVINLNHARKTKLRDDKEKTAAANRAKFGQSKAEREKHKALQQQATKRLDAHKREPET